MDDIRYPKLCYMALKDEINSSSIHCKKYNWYVQLRTHLEKIGSADILLNNDVGTVYGKISDSLCKLIDSQRQQDINSVTASQNYAYYSLLIPETPRPAKYLHFNFQWKKLSILSQ